ISISGRPGECGAFLALLRTHRKRPCSRAAEQRDELAALHSITLSASASNLSGISRPSAFAVLRLMTSSNLVDCITGKSAGLAPLRMRPAYGRLADTCQSGCFRNSAGHQPHKMREGNRSLVSPDVSPAL